MPGWRSLLVDPFAVEKQLPALADPGADAVKIGMLGSLRIPPKAIAQTGKPIAESISSRSGVGA